MLYNRLVYKLVDNNLLLNTNVEFGMELYQKIDRLSRNLIDMNTMSGESISIAVAFIKNNCMLLGSGLQWSNLAKPVNIDDDFSMAIVFVMLVSDCVLYGFIMFYVDNVWPGEYGIPQPWYFLFTVSPI